MSTTTLVFSSIGGLALGAILAASPAGANDEPDLELGEYLAAECTTCHRADAVNQGIPSIYGKPRFVFIQTMEQYRDGTRINQAMQNVARSLGDEEIAALAAWFELNSPY